MADAAAESKKTGPSAEEVKAAFEKYDADGSGFLDRAELFAMVGELGVLLDDEEMEEAYKALDTSGDDKIQFDEFKAWIENVDPNEKSYAKLGVLKTRLYSSWAVKFMRTTSEPPKNDDARISISFKEIKNVVQTGTISLGRHVAPVASTGGMGKLHYGYDFGYNGGKDFLDYVQTILKTCKSMVPPDARAMFNFDIQDLDGKHMRVRASIPADPQVAMLIPMIEEKLGSVKLKIELGWDVTEDFATKCLRDVFETKITFIGAVPPEVQGLLSMAVPMLEQMGFEVSDVPGLQELLEGQTTVDMDLSAFVDTVIGMVPVPPEIKALLDVPFNKLVLEFAKASPMPMELFAVPFKAGVMVMHGICAYLYILARDITSMQGTTCYHEETGFGMKSESDGKATFLDVYKFVKACIPDVAEVEALCRPAIEAAAAAAQPDEQAPLLG